MKSHGAGWSFSQTIVPILVFGTLLFVNGIAYRAHAQDKDKVVPAGNLESSPLDQPLALLHEAKRNFSAVKDYTCTLVSQERVRGKLEEQNVMQFKMKTEPFSIYMRWLAPKKAAGQEVAFVLGKNNNKMRVKSNVIGGKLIGFLSIDPNDPRVLQHSNHNILEAGLGNMIEQNIRHWDLARRVGKSKVAVSDAKFNGRDCIRIDVAATERTPQAYCYRSVIFLEKSSKFPLRQENYDWPRTGGERGGDLMEAFSYYNLEFNRGLKDAEFNK